MKNKAKILGLVTVILLVLTVIAKIWHLPGASYGFLLTLGLLFPVYLIINLVSLSKDDRFGIPVMLSGYCFLVFTTGFLFHLNHWPFAGFLFKGGFLITVLSLFVAYFVESRKSAGQKRLPVIVVILSIMTVSLIFMAIYRNTSGNLINGFVQANNTTTITKEALLQLNEKYVSEADSTHLILKEVHKTTMQIVNEIEDLKMEIARTADKNVEAGNYDHIRGMESLDVTNQVIFTENEGEILKISIEKYRDYLVNLNPGTDIKEKIYNLLNTQNPPVIEGEILSWVEAMFRGLPVISVIAVLTDLQVEILTSESLILQK
jgi:hypothetical protein